MQKLGAPHSKMEVYQHREISYRSVAEEFYNLFGLGTDDKGISTVDPAGISLAAIKELIKETESLRKELQLLKLELAELARVKK